MRFFLTILTFLISLNIYAEDEYRIFRWNIESLKIAPINVALAHEFIPILNGDGMEPSGLNGIELMALKWNIAHPTLDFFSLPFTVASNKDYANLDEFFDDEIGIYYSKNWYPELDSKYVAITQFFGSIKNKGKENEYFEIAHGDIIVNFKDHIFSTEGDPSKYDLLSIIIHEMGHLIGLPHVKDLSIPSIMSPNLERGEERRDLSDFDIAKTLKYYPIHSSEIQNKDFLLNNKKSEKLERYIMKLGSDGTCYHYLNGRFIFSH